MEQMTWGELIRREGWRAVKRAMAKPWKTLTDATWNQGIWSGVSIPAPENLARQWGRLNFQSVVRYAPKAPVFVHCHECRWPVSPGRTHMLLGNGQRVEASEEQMQRICDGVRRKMGAA